RASDLETKAAAFDPHRSRRAPTASAGPPAFHKTFSVFAPDNERALLHSGYDHHALRLFKQVLGYALIGRSHDLGKNIGCRSKAFLRCFGCLKPGRGKD